MDNKKRIVTLLVVMVVVLGGSLAAYGVLMQQSNLAAEAAAHMGIDVPPGAELRRYFDEDHGHYHYYLHLPGGETQDVTPGHDYNTHYNEHDAHDHDVSQHDIDLPEGAELRRYFDESHGHYHYYLYFPDGEPEHSQTHEHIHHAQIPAPDFPMMGQDGELVNLSSLMGGRPMLLSFWAIESQPAIDGLLELEAAYAAMGAEVQFVILNVVDSAGDGLDEAQELGDGFAMPMFYDTTSTGMELYGINSVPQTFFIDADGFIASFAVGAIDQAIIREGISIASN